MLKRIDAIWFAMKDRWKGFVRGECAIETESYDNGWDDGFNNGVVTGRLAAQAKLTNMNPKLSNAEFQLGYSHAVAIVKGEI